MLPDGTSQRRLFDVRVYIWKTFYNDVFLIVLFFMQHRFGTTLG